MSSPIIKIPLELKANYLRDPENFLRDIACVPTESTRPFFKDKNKVYEVEKKAFKNPFNDEERRLERNFVPVPGADDFSRYMHIDLGLKKDAVGISMCHAPNFEQRVITQIHSDELVDEEISLPFIKFDFLGRIKANKGEEILLSKVREIIYDIQQRGFYLALITFDGFQSVDSIQILRSQGFKVGRLSIDRTATKLILDKKAKDGSGLVRRSTEGQTMGPMQALKDAIYDDRLAVPYHEYFAKEAIGAEIDYKKNKVDHKPRGSLDLLQSMAGSVYNLINNEFDYQDPYEDGLKELGDDFYADKQVRENYWVEDKKGRKDLWVS